MPYKRLSDEAAAKAILRAFARQERWTSLGPRILDPPALEEITPEPDDAYPPVVSAEVDDENAVEQEMDHEDASDTDEEEYVPEDVDNPDDLIDTGISEESFPEPLYGAFPIEVQGPQRTFVNHGINATLEQDLSMPRLPNHSKLYLLGSNLSLPLREERPIRPPGLDKQ